MIDSNISQIEQKTRFNAHFEGLLSKLSQKSQKCFIFTDTNIDLLNAKQNSTAHEYLNTIMSYGFIQTVIKATRMQGESYLLIDHIITNCTSPLFTTGTIISDVIDLFPIFI